MTTSGFLDFKQKYCPLAFMFKLHLNSEDSPKQCFLQVYTKISRIVTSSVFRGEDIVPWLFLGENQRQNQSKKDFLSFFFIEITMFFVQ